MPMTVECPSCGKGCGIPDSFKGGSVRCPSCRQPFTIPAAQAIPKELAIPVAQVVAPPLPRESMWDRSLIVRLVKWLIRPTTWQWLIRLPTWLGTLNVSQRVGVILLTIGLVITLYYLLLYDTTVSTIGEGLVAREFDVRVHNLGRMNQKLVGIITGIGLSIVGAILYVVRRDRPK